MMSNKNYKFGVRKMSRGVARRRGSVLMEAALVSIFVLLPLTLAIIQYGIVFNATNTLSQITREGGRAAAVFALKTSAEQPGVGMDADTYILSRMQVAAASTSLDFNDMNITISPAMNVAGGTPTRVKGQPITVTVSYDMKKKYFFPWLSGGGDQTPQEIPGAPKATFEKRSFTPMPKRVVRTSTMMME